jgi:hypothetical protein
MTTTTTEAFAGARPDAPLDPPPSTWLPLTAGDAARGRELAQPEHGWPASWFIFLSNLAALACGVGAVGVAVATFMDLVPPGTGAALFAGLVVGAVVQGSLARHVKHFTRWGWYGAMAELALATLTKVSTVTENPSAIGGAAIGIIIDLLWMHYFWERRADFDVDSL